MEEQGLQVSIFPTQLENFHLGQGEQNFFLQTQETGS
jgi:hypothetical protein